MFISRQHGSRSSPWEFAQLQVPHCYSKKKYGNAVENKVSMTQRSDMQFGTAYAHRVEIGPLQTPQAIYIKPLKP